MAWAIADTLGLFITVTVVAASVQDRDGAKSTLLGLCRLVWADAGFAGRLVEWVAQTARTTVSIVGQFAGPSTTPTEDHPDGPPARTKPVRASARGGPLLMDLSLAAVER